MTFSSSSISCSPSSTRGSLVGKFGLALVFAAALPGVHANNCFINDFGQEECNTNTGERIGIAIGIAAIFIILFSVFAYYRRRRMLRQNLIYIQRGQQDQEQQNGQYPYGNAGYPPPPPRQSNYGGGYAGNYNPTDVPSYSPPRAPPPAKK